MSIPDPNGTGRCARCARELRPADWPAVARAAFLLAAVSVAIHVVPFAVVRRWVLAAGAGGDGWCPGCASRAVSAAAALLRPRPTCLARAIVLVHLLRQAGRDARVVIGVTRHGGLAAHAWVEDGGRAIGDGASARERFAVLAGRGDCCRDLPGRSGSRGAEGPV